MNTTVVYISSCATTADGTPDTFLLQELPWLRRHFRSVLVCSGYGIAEIGEDRPKTVTVSRPAFGALRACVQAAFHRQFRSEIRRLRTDGKLTLQAVLKLWIFTVRGLKLYHWISAMLRKDEQTTVYAYWMSFDGFAAALCKHANPAVRVIARGHAFDIDVLRNPLNPYLMKRFMARTLDGIYPINDSAKAQILSYVDVPPGKLRVVGVGSVGEKAVEHLPAPRFADGVFRVVSCAAMIAIKQIPLLIDALAAWDAGKLHWLHIGGGADENDIRDYAHRKLDDNPLVTYELPGSLPPERVQAIYQARPFDVFINTSKNEGTPVAVMEALHAGIPVVAPKIGGIPELIDDSVGCLYKKDGGIEQIVEALTIVYRKTEQDTWRMRDAAQARWNERCAIDNLLPRIFTDETETSS